MPKIVGCPKTIHRNMQWDIGLVFQWKKNEAGEDVVVGTGDTGFDVYCVEGLTIPAKGSAIVNTGLELSYISPGYWFMISARSGLGFKSGIQPHPGIVDNGYRGGLGVKLYNLSDTDYTVNAGDRIAQLVFYPVIEPTMGWAEAIQTSPRNDKGFGSSGK